MKQKILFLLIFLLPQTFFSSGSEYFSFTIGAGGGYDTGTGGIYSENIIGFSYPFNDKFSGGFHFINAGGQQLDMVQISVTPINHFSINMYSGKISTNFGFGTGIGYDFLTGTNRLYTALGFYIDWFGGNGVPYNAADGGLLTFGLRTKIGL